MTREKWLHASIAKSALVLAATNIIPSAAIAQNQAATTVSGNLQPRNENGRQVYELSQFSRFNPRTALDIVQQVPGFNIQTGNNDERGLGQADGNVIINGARIAGKNNDAFTVLGRISAANVIRVEIIDGASLSISGLSGQVLNLVTQSEDTGITGNFKWRPQFRRSGDDWLNGEVSISGKLGKGDFTLALENSSFRDGELGPERITSGTGALLFERDEVALRRGDRPQISASYARASDAGSVFNITGQYQLARFRESVNTRRAQNATPEIFELFSSRENEWNAELSADYEFALGGGRLKLIGLQRLEHSPTRNFFGQRFTDNITPANGNQFEQITDEGESVLRAEYSWKTDGGTDWGINLEGAYNFLDNEGQLSVLDTAGVFQPVVLDNATSRVEEKRAELIGTYGRALSGNLTLQAALGGEYSTITQSGVNGQTRSFVRPKGSVTLAWKPASDLDVSFKLERKVGQLNFFDFIASIEVANDVLNAGNPDLVPPQSWNAEIEATQNMGAFGTTTVTAYYNKISDIVDSIPITATTEASGNLDSAKQYGLKLESTFLLDPIGWKGAKIDVLAEGQKSSVRDPLTLRTRRISNDLIYNYEVNFRHDIPQSDFAYGAFIGRFDGVPNIRLDQIADFDERAPYSAIFVEHKDIFGLTVNANLGNLFNRKNRFRRTVFQDRRDGPIAFVEERNRTFGLVYRLTISGSF